MELIPLFTAVIFCYLVCRKVIRHYRDPGIELQPMKIVKQTDLRNGEYEFIK
jgi:hypothetical protein